MEIYGSGMLNLGYLGGVYDAGTGLIYMGNGQYYDPSTGRFLTRGAQQDQNNPYTPWNSDPAGMLIAPLALLALVFGRKKVRTKFDQFVILFVIVFSVGLSLLIFGGSFTVQAKPVNSNVGFIVPTPIPGVTPTATTTSTSTSAVLPPLTSANISDYFATTQFNKISIGSATAPANAPTTKCAVTPPYPSGYYRMFARPTVYWNGMTSSQLGAYQRDQGDRNDCALYSIAAAINLLENNLAYDGKKLSKEVDRQWNAGRTDLRWEPNSATLPANQINIIHYINDTDSRSYTTGYGSTNKTAMTNVLSKNYRLQLLTIYFFGKDAPTLYYNDPIKNTSYEANFEVRILDQVNSTPNNPVYEKDRKGNDKIIFATGHTMLLVAHDPTMVNPNDSQVYEWGFINSWRVGGGLYWMRDTDLKIFDVVTIYK